MIYNIINEAKKLGACNKVENADSIAELAELFYTPQGIEFCKNNKFPKLSTFRELKEEIAGYGFLVDCGPVYRENDIRSTIVGKTAGKLKFDKNNCIFTVVVMHGASVEIEASNYVVLNVIKIGDCRVELNVDNTVIVL